MRNIVICCDGTGSQISENISNVLKLYRCLRKTDKTTPRQLVHYDPGIGTLARPDPWRKLWQDFKVELGLLTGYGLDDTVLTAYEFLVNHYQEGDRIFLFGFSRGAYTVRVLAGLIHKVGLIAPEQINLAGYGLTAYKQFSQQYPDNAVLPPQFVDHSDGEPNPVDRYDAAAQFARITSARLPTIHFMGVWETVASIIVPRRDRLYWPSLEELAYTMENPSVKTFRQAISIDERRTSFRVKRWKEPQPFLSNRFIPPDKVEAQDSRQVWFAGVHMDIGGAYPEAQSALSKYPLLWMIDEACACGLTVNPQTVKHLGWGELRRGSPFTYVAPDVRGELHDPMTLGWRIMEYVPKRAKYREWPQRKVHMGFYIPAAEPRFIQDGALIHESAIQRMNVTDYRPVNLPGRYEIVPMPMPPD